MSRSSESTRIHQSKTVVDKEIEIIQRCVSRLLTEYKELELAHGTERAAQMMQQSAIIQGTPDDKRETIDSFLSKTIDSQTTIYSKGISEESYLISTRSGQESGVIRKKYGDPVIFIDELRKAKSSSRAILNIPGLGNLLEQRIALEHAKQDDVRIGSIQSDPTKASVVPRVIIQDDNSLAVRLKDVQTEVPIDNSHVIHFEGTKSSSRSECQDHEILSPQIVLGSSPSEIMSNMQMIYAQARKSVKPQAGSGTTLTFGYIDDEHVATCNAGDSSQFLVVKTTDSRNPYRVISLTETDKVLSVRGMSTLASNDCNFQREVMYDSGILRVNRVATPGSQLDQGLEKYNQPVFQIHTKEDLYRAKGIDPKTVVSSELLAVCDGVTDILSTEVIEHTLNKYHQKQPEGPLPTAKLVAAAAYTVSRVESPSYIDDTSAVSTTTGLVGMCDGHGINGKQAAQSFAETISTKAKAVSTTINKGKQQELASKIMAFSKETNLTKKLAMFEEIVSDINHMHRKNITIRTRDVKNLVESVANAYKNPDLDNEQRKGLANHLADIFSIYEQQHKQTPGKLNHLFKTNFLKKASSVFSTQDRVGSGLDAILDQCPQLLIDLKDSVKSKNFGESRIVDAIKSKPSSIARRS